MPLVRQFIWLSLFICQLTYVLESNRSGGIFRVGLKPMRENEFNGWHANLSHQQTEVQSKKFTGIINAANAIYLLW